MRRRLMSLGLVAFLGLGTAAFAQVTGVVNDANGFPESDAEVIVKGTGKVAITDENGNFDIDAKVGDVLVINGKEFKVTSNKLGVLRAQEPVDLGEVVLTGYSTKKKENITTSVAIINAKEINNIPITSFDQLLAGKAPGVEVNIGSGQPGSPASVVIRGAGSINGGTTPLYVVDGVQVNAGVFATLNPNSFESISILKDAAAKSIYGSQAGNGVIIVKTKGGRKNSPLTISYNSNVGVSMKPESKFDMMTTAEILETQKKLGWWDFNNPADVKEFNELSEINTDWNKVFLKEGITYQNDINFSGGSENTDFYIALGHLDQKGIVKNTGLQRFTGTININSGNGKNFRFGVNSNFGYSKKDVIVGEAAVALNNPLAASYLALPYQSLYKKDGSFNTGASELGANAYETLMTQQRLTQELKAVVGVYGEYDLNSDFTFRLFGAIDHTGRFYKGYVDPNTFGGQTTNPGKSGSITRQYFQYDGVNTNAMLKWNKKINNHSINAFVATEYVGKFIDGFSLSAFGLNKYLGNSMNSAQVTKDLLPSIALSANGLQNNRSVHIISYFGNLDYSYNDKYLLSANVRRDGGSLFSSDYKWGTFGGVSAAWVLSKEDFLASSIVLSDLKVRASWGRLGNTGDLFGASLYNSSRYLSQGQYDGGSTLFPSAPLNTEFRWEVEEQYDLGIDFGFFGNRVTGSVDYYNRLTSDLYIDKSLSLTTGFDALETYNGGEMRNRGIEAALNVDILRDKDVKLSVYANFAYNKNEITNLGEVTSYSLGTSMVQVGLPFGSHYAVKWGGVDPTDGSPIYLGKDGQRLTSFDGSEAQSTYGSSYAPYSGGFGLNFNYKGLFLEAAFQFKADYYRFNNMRFFNENAANLGNYNQYKVVSTVWTEPGQVTDIQSPSHKMEFTSKFIEDSSFLRLRNVRLGYTFAPELLNNSGIKGVTIYTNATNLLTWTKWTGLDPDDSNNLSSYEYPSPRIVTMGVNLTF